MEIITFAAVKGGVGKTTLSYNFSAYLADLGYKVLMIDFDHQCNLSQILGIYDQKNTVLSFGGGLFLGVYLGLYFLFQREITDITFFMGIFIIIATLILVSGWKYKGPINILTSCGFGSGIGFFAGFFGVPTGPLTGLFFLSLKEEVKIIQANIQCIVIFTLIAFFSYFYFIEGFRSDFLLLGLVMSIPLAIGLKVGQYLFTFLPEKIFRPITYICLLSLGASLCFNAYN